MKIHSNTLTTKDIWASTIATGMLGVHVDDDIVVKGSRSRTRSFNVKLTGNSNHAPNNGRSGGFDYGEKAASWDEWGIFINALFLVDPEAIVGQYKSYADFKAYTCNRFDTLDWADSHRQHKWVRPGDYTGTCKCGSKVDWSSFYPAANAA
jgi:hypothetical protein